MIVIAYSRFWPANKFSIAENYPWLVRSIQERSPQYLQRSGWRIACFQDGRGRGLADKSRADDRGDGGSQENGKHENRYQQTANRVFCRRFFLAGSNRFFRS